MPNHAAFENILAAGQVDPCAAFADFILELVDVSSVGVEQKLFEFFLDAFLAELREAQPLAFFADRAFFACVLRRDFAFRLAVEREVPDVPVAFAFLPELHDHFRERRASTEFVDVLCLELHGQRSENKFFILLHDDRLIDRAFFARVEIAGCQRLRNFYVARRGAFLLPVIAENPDRHFDADGRFIRALRVDEGRVQNLDDADVIGRIDCSAVGILREAGQRGRWQQQDQQCQKGLFHA